MDIILYLFTYFKIVRLSCKYKIVGEVRQTGSTLAFFFSGIKRLYNNGVDILFLLEKSMKVKVLEY